MYNETREEATRKEARILARQVARQLTMDPGSVESSQVSGAHVLMYLMGEYPRRVQDAVAKVLGRSEKGEDEHWLALKENDKKYGLHSNIPPCCVDFIYRVMRLSPKDTRS